jgi:hypothetical protein
MPPMPRLLRIFASTLVVISLLLCLTTVVLWMRSHRVADSLTHGRNASTEDGSLIRRYASVKSSRGKLVVGRGYFSSALFRSVTIKEGFGFSQDSSPPAGPQARTVVWSRLGFVFTRVDSPGMLVSHALWIPHWCAALAFGIAPAAWLWKRQRQAARSSRNLCPNCGYDLRATPDRCPECGTIAKPPANPTTTR